MPPWPPHRRSPGSRSTHSDATAAGGVETVADAKSTGIDAVVVGVGFVVAGSVAGDESTGTNAVGVGGAVVVTGVVAGVVAGDESTGRKLSASSRVATMACTPINVTTATPPTTPTLRACWRR